MTNDRDNAHRISGEALLAALSIVTFVVVASVLVPLLTDYDDWNTEDITDRLLANQVTYLRPLLGGKLTCVFPPGDFARAGINLSLGQYRSNRYEYMKLDWDVVALHPDTMQMIEYSVDDHRLKFPAGDAPCGTNLKIPVAPGSPPTAIIENIEIKSLGRVTDDGR